MTIIVGIVDRFLKKLLNKNLKMMIMKILWYLQIFWEKHTQLILMEQGILLIYQVTKYLINLKVKS